MENPRLANQLFGQRLVRMANEIGLPGQGDVSYCARSKFWFLTPAATGSSLSIREVGNRKRAAGEQGLADQSFTGGALCYSIDSSLDQ